jgi:hypothetical protein
LPALAPGKLCNRIADDIGGIPNNTRWSANA